MAFIERKEQNHADDGTRTLSVSHHIFIISQLWLTSHPRSTVVLLDTGTPGTSREIYSENANDGSNSCAQ